MNRNGGINRINPLRDKVCNIIGGTGVQVLTMVQGLAVVQGLVLC